MDKAPDKAKRSVGTYQVTDSEIITTLSGFEIRHPYTVENGEVVFYWTPDSGKDKGETREYRRISDDPSIDIANFS